MKGYRPDFSNYLAHFTTDRAPVSNIDDNPTNGPTTGLSAYDRLVAILETKTILASSLPWTGRNAVCLTECPWSSLIHHADEYSSFGIGFNKAHVFNAGGGPVFYIRKELWDKQEWHPHLKTFATPFWPKYRSKKLKEEHDFKTVDYSHEREWRVPHDFNFEYSDIQFVVVEKYEDMAKFPAELKNQIGREKFLIMEIYNNIEQLWPVHNI